MNTSLHHPNDDATTPVLVSEGFAKPAAQASPGATRWLALGAVVGPILFTLAWIILGELSPGYTAWGIRIAPYSPISQPISGLGLGPTAPFMNAAFVLTGLLTLVGVDGIFTLESFLPHTAGFLLATASPVPTFVVIGLLLRRIPRFRRFGTWLLLGSPLTLALVVLYFLTFSPTVAGIQTGVAGLTERILAVEVHAWLVALGALAFRRATRSVALRG